MAEKAPGGILGSLRRLGASFLAVIRVRVELFALELQQEKHWLVATLLWSAAAIFFGVTTIVLAILTILKFCPEPVLPWALLGLFGVFLALSVWAAAKLRRQFRSGAAFSGTLEELRKDLDQLKK